MGSFNASKLLGLLPKLQGEANYYDWTGDVHLVLFGHGLEHYIQSKTADSSTVDPIIDRQLAAVLLLSMAQHLKDDFKTKSSTTLLLWNPLCTKFGSPSCMRRAQLTSQFWGTMLKTGQPVL